MIKIKEIFCLIIFFVFSSFAFPQNVTERVILTAESNEAAKDLYYKIGINKNGDYGFFIDNNTIYSYLVMIQ